MGPFQSICLVTEMKASGHMDRSPSIIMETADRPTSTSGIGRREIRLGESLGPSLVQTKGENSCLALPRERDDPPRGR